MFISPSPGAAAAGRLPAARPGGQEPRDCSQPRAGNLPRNLKIRYLRGHRSHDETQTSDMKEMFELNFSLDLASKINI